ncbi:MAG TPA: SDR family NAD(P)-dependent oxidoreductase [Clostridia bacterium]|nr:SDR family NAD(P)-dependent oxidoreductase [Clostridia bacterium]
MRFRLPSSRFVALSAAGLAAGGAVAGVGMALAGRAAWNYMRATDLRGQVVLITGASRGLGFAMAQEFAALGCRLVICARKEDELEWAAEDLRRRGPGVLAIRCDVANRDDVNKMVEQATAHFGGIDVLVNNAGVIAVGPIECQSIEDFEEAMNVMFWGVVYPTLAVLPQMRARRSGRIANITSIGGKISVPHLVPYGCAKFAAVGFSEGLAAELAKDNIKVTTVVPGLMRTGSHVNAEFKGDNRAEFTWFSLGAATPVTAIGARRAARSIVAAVRRGTPEVILGVPANIAARVHGIFPGATISALGLVNRWMPGTGSFDKSRHSGAESENAISRSFVTKLGRDAGRELHQYPAQRVAG